MKYQVVILAGGESSRFFPFNNVHKCLFKLDGKAILEHTLESVKKVKPSEIILVLGSKNFAKEKEICESLPAFEGVKFACEEKPLGQADGILSAKEYIKNDFFVINASQFNFDSLADKFVETHRLGDLVTVGISETEAPSKYGIAKLEDGRVKGVVEKPTQGSEPSNMRLVGIYFLNREFVNELAKTPISEYSLEETLDRVAKEGKVGSVHIKETQPSLKYPWDILDLKNMILCEKKNKIEHDAKIEKTALLKGSGIFISKKAHIYDFAIIEGPCYIGENAVVGAYSQVRGGSIIGKDAQVERYCDVKNSVIGDGTHIHSGFVGDSVIGENCRIGAGFITANKRLDRESVKVVVKGEKVNSDLKNLGIFVGNSTKIGIRVSSMPGAIIGEKSLVFPAVSVKGTHGVGSEIDE